MLTKNPLGDDSLVVYPDRVVIGGEEIVFDDKGGVKWATVVHGMSERKLDLYRLSVGFWSIVAAGLKRSTRVLNGGVRLLGGRGNGEQVVLVAFNFADGDFVKMVVLADEYESMKEAIVMVSDGDIAYYGNETTDETVDESTEN